TKDILKGAIKDIDGTVIVVRHDRFFLDGLVEKVYEFGGGKVIENLGGIYDFLQKKKLDNLKQLEVSSTPAGGNEKNNPEIQEESEGKISYAQQKEKARLRNKAEKAVAKYEKEIDEYEARLKEIEEKLAAGDASSETLQTYSEVQKRIEEAMSKWEMAQVELEEL
ncbi:MAG: ABC transporter ATP-binding protein, partial [Muribaculaceae bacterium]|nr:ABC transporter ATP-binding protein [Muribaculaceae bacterium]